LGLLLNVVIHPADVQDRDGAFHLLRRARRLFPFIERISRSSNAFLLMADTQDARWQ
jgi:hypothetical protein